MIQIVDRDRGIREKGDSFSFFSASHLTVTEDIRQTRAESQIKTLVSSINQDVNPRALASAKHWTPPASDRPVFSVSTYICPGKVKVEAPTGMKPMVSKRRVADLLGGSLSTNRDEECGIQETVGKLRSTVLNNLRWVGNLIDSFEQSQPNFGGKRTVDCQPAKGAQHFRTTA